MSEEKIVQELASINASLDQECVFTVEGIRRIEKEIADRSREIKEMKLKLNIA